MSGKEQERMIDAETLRKLLMGGKDDDEFSMGNIGTITMAPHSHIYFYCDVVPESILKLNTVMIQMAKENLSDAAARGIETPDPINLHINSPGGIASAGFVGYDLISELTNKLEIRSYVEGNCSSAATLLSIGASKRYITPSSTMLIHELSTFIGGKLSEITTEFENCKKVEAIIENIYLKHTKIKKEELKELLRKDVLLTAEDCLEKGLVDEIKTSIF